MKKSLQGEPITKKLSNSMTYCCIKKCMNPKQVVEQCNYYMESTSLSSLNKFRPTKETKLIYEIVSLVQRGQRDSINSPLVSDFNQASTVAASSSATRTN
ncbi:hypothetical protein ABZP36_033407 [Zizania latifolia]